MTISQIPTLRAHIWQTRSWEIYPLKWQCHIFLLRGLISGRPSIGRSSIPHLKCAISQIPTLRTHIWQVRSGHIYPSPPQWYHRFLLWELIFGRPGRRRSTLSNGNVTDSYSEGSYLADQVLVDPPLSLSVSNDNFTDSYSESSYLAGQVLHEIYPNPSQGFHRFLLLRAHI